MDDRKARWESPHKEERRGSASDGIERWTEGSLIEEACLGIMPLYITITAR